MVDLDLVWTTDPVIRPRSEMVRSQSRWLKIWVALLIGPWLKSLIANASKLALLLDFMNVAVIKSKENYQNVFTWG